jgi:hypothetical protein
VIFAFGVFGPIAGRPEKHLDVLTHQIGNCGIDIRLALGDHCQVVQPGAIVVILGAICLAFEPEIAPGPIGGTEDAPLVIDGLPPKESEEVFVKSDVLRIPEEDQMPKARVHKTLLSYADRRVGTGLALRFQRGQVD